LSTIVERNVDAGDTGQASLQRAVVHSALWAAAGDALGWITELAHSRSNVKRRTGSDLAITPVAWQRLIGGRNGPKVNLPPGTYSDDTQLRLAVARSIRGNGHFDVEAFAKIEVTVWPTYALGGGLGTKAAALNLAKRGVSWFSNFYESKGQRYVDGGGNGAAMRIQPHVWSSRRGQAEMLLDVLRNSLATHGHPHAFCGAVFHAAALSAILQSHRIPGPGEWLAFVDLFSSLPALVSKDPQLSAFWVTAWESSTGRKLEAELEATSREARRDIAQLSGLLGSPDPQGYRMVLEALECTTPKYRGSGLKTAIAAMALSFMYREGSIEEALRCAANELDSDTDTIATMAGALLGAVCQEEPNWPIQDRKYIVAEAQRLASIRMGRDQDSFSYPDTAEWKPPSSQKEAVGVSGNGLAISGLGELEPIGDQYPSGDAIWQWFRLPFGQTILAKRHAKDMDLLQDSQLPRSRQSSKLAAGTGHVVDTATTTRASVGATVASTPRQLTAGSLDAVTDQIIASNFDDTVLGRLLNQCIDDSQSVDFAVAVAAIIAKAKLVRGRRQRR
jgi:ADP-ribosylglycohydrolase